ncbi:MAG: hypothetical protein N2039_06785 [Gemmataceae bacterium]|nr:hypothetical protein [Gemmataceae bacterium]
MTDLIYREAALSSRNSYLIMALRHREKGMSVFRLPLVALVVGMHLNGSLYSADDEIRRRFRELYQPHAERLARDWGTFKIRTSRISPGPEVTEKMTATEFVSPRCWYSTFQTVGIDNQTNTIKFRSAKMIEAGNNHYAFIVSKSKSEQNYTLSSVRRYQTKVERFQWEGVYRDIVLTGKPYIDLVDDPAVKFLALGPARFADLPCYELAVFSPNFERPGGDTKPAVCSFFFDDQRGWLGIGWRSSLLEGETKRPIEETEITYDRAGDGLLRFSKMSHWWRFSKDGQRIGKPSVEAVVEEFERLEAIDEAQSRLSYYGLPEPADVIWEKPTPMYVWLLLAAAVCAVLAFTLRWWVKRRQRQAVS